MFRLGGETSNMGSLLQVNVNVSSQLRERNCANAKSAISSSVKYVY